MYMTGILLSDKSDVFRLVQKRMGRSRNNFPPAQRGMIPTNRGWHYLGASFEAVAAVGEHHEADA
jgi:hypothetical protein